MSTVIEIFIQNLMFFVNLDIAEVVNHKILFNNRPKTNKNIKIKKNTEFKMLFVRFVLIPDLR